ncbi:MAG TPA: GNAT family N-acetyltransferase [Candidatus Dormibacteraeota bacterium]|jgi:ribosomal protein S18 acetylase RimI-like enzyme|nr:GNAT family N-acetyltransferase [Candidatus Dormibacteraeota bacterium]
MTGPKEAIIGDAMLIRPCTPGEVSALVRLWRDAGTVATIGEDLPTLSGLVGRDDQPVLVAVDESGDVVGSLIIGWDGWRGHMYRMAVHPAHRRQGIALALVREGEQRLRDRGARRIGAVVVAADPRATAFWIAAGYRPQVDMRRHVKDFT